MALPKRRSSKAKVGKRRQQWRASAPTTMPCPNCSTPDKPVIILRHRVCPQCGYYQNHKGTLHVFDVKQKKPAEGAAR